MTRKVLSTVLVLLLLLTTIAAIPVLAETITTSVKTAKPGDTLYVRKGPHKGNTPTVGTVKNKDKIKLYYSEDDSDPEAWAKIKVVKSGAVGYIKNKYVKYYDFDNSEGEVNVHEDDDYDYSSSSDNDGSQGTSSSSSSSSKTKLGTIKTKNGGSVNVRKRASTSSAAISKASSGSKIDILSKSGAWYRVKTAKDVTGYVHGSYVSEGITGYTTARDGLHLRKRASSSSDILRTIPYDKNVTVYSKSGNWLYVKYSGTYGYVSGKYCKY